MITLDADRAECLVFTYKEGLLSPMAHDLKLRVTRLTIELDDAELHARFDAASLRVVCAIKGGREAPGALSQRDRASIEDNISSDVLHSRKYPEILFDSTSLSLKEGRAEVRGTLTLHGRSRELVLSATRGDDGRYHAETRLNQPDFGIKPFTAMLGAMKIRPEVLIRLSLPA